MTSFQTGVTPQRRAAARYISHVRSVLQRALADVQRERGMTQSDIAREIGVHRSVISREIRGEKDLTHRRVGELAWAMGYRPRLVLERAGPEAGVNSMNLEPAARSTRGAESNATIFPSPASPLPATTGAEVTVEVNVYEAT